MAEQNEKILQELLRHNGNNKCADCTSRHVEWASYNIGIFICTRCAGVHRAMGAHISKVKHLKLDKWEDSQIERMKEVGNLNAKKKYEYRVPECYRRPIENDPQVLIEQWIRAKYERLEFTENGRLNFMSGYMEGFLMKRGKEDSRYQPRKFVLSESEDILKYHIKESKEPKAIIRLSELNVAFAPNKIGHKNSMQLTFMKDGSTRHIYVYHNDSEIIVNWYMAIRCAKFRRLQIAYPTASDFELFPLLTRDFPKEGWLYKTGPRPNDGYKRRWFTLDNRKLMYHDEPLDAYPKGEIFLGYLSDGYNVCVTKPIQTSTKSRYNSVSASSGGGGGNSGSGSIKDIGYSFTLFTPERVYNLSASSEQDRDEWINVISKVLERQLTPQDSSMSSRLIRKRTGTNAINIFTGR